MSIVIVVVLAVVWVVALTPMVLRRISERQFTSGAMSHHRRLSRLRTSAAVSSGSIAASVPGATIGFSVAAQRLHEQRGGAQSSSSEASVATPPLEPLPIAEPASVGEMSVSLGASPATAARRRRVVALLVGATLVFFLIGIVPAARLLWDMALLTLGCTAAYAALLIHFHRLSVERAQKVIAMRTRRHVTAELESRRHVIALDRARHDAVASAYTADAYEAGGYRTGGYANVGTSYASGAEPVLSGSGWSMTGVHSQRVTRH